jgi:hypothetical protein
MTPQFHLMIGLMEIATASITQTRPSLAHGDAAPRRLRD